MVLFVVIKVMFTVREDGRDGDGGDTNDGDSDDFDVCVYRGHERDGAVM